MEVLVEGSLEELKSRVEVSSRVEMSSQQKGDQHACRVSRKQGARNVSDAENRCVFSMIRGS